jgi:hypothetical protein
VYRFDKMKDENFRCTDRYTTKMIQTLQSVSISTSITNGPSYSLKYLVHAQLIHSHTLPTEQVAPGKVVWEFSVFPFQMFYSSDLHDW